MNEDRIKGAATDLGGRLKKAVGGLMGDTARQAEGRVDQVRGQALNAYGSAKNAMRDGASVMGSEVDSFVAHRPVMALLMAVGVGYALSSLLRR